MHPGDSSFTVTVSDVQHTLKRTCIWFGMHEAHDVNSFALPSQPHANCLYIWLITVIGTNQEILVSDSPILVVLFRYMISR